MSDVEAWTVRALIGVVVTALCGGAGIAGLFVRLRNLEAKRAAADVRIGALENRDNGTAQLQEIQKELHQMHLCMVQNYISREDFVPMASKVLGALERQGQLVARLEERLDARTGDRHAG